MFDNVMRIENAKWIELAPADGDNPAIMSGVSANINGQEMFVPIDVLNIHWKEIQRQVDAGTLTIADAD